MLNSGVLIANVTIISKTVKKNNSINFKMLKSVHHQIIHIINSTCFVTIRNQCTTRKQQWLRPYRQGSAHRIPTCNSYMAISFPFVYHIQNLFRTRYKSFCTTLEICKSNTEEFRGIPVLKRCQKERLARMDKQKNHQHPLWSLAMRWTKICPYVTLRRSWQDNLREYFFTKFNTQSNPNMHQKRPPMLSTRGIIQNIFL